MTSYIKYSYLRAVSTDIYTHVELFDAGPDPICQGAAGNPTIYLSIPSETSRFLSRRETAEKSLDFGLYKYGGSY